MCIASKNNNKTDRHDITEILLKVALNTITLKKNETIRNDQRDITVRHTEKQLRQRNVGKCNGS